MCFDLKWPQMRLTYNSVVVAGLMSLFSEAIDNNETIIFEKPLK